MSAEKMMQSIREAACCFRRAMGERAAQGSQRKISARWKKWGILSEFAEKRPSTARRPTVVRGRRSAVLAAIYWPARKPRCACGFAEPGEAVINPNRLPER